MNKKTSKKKVAPAVGKVRKTRHRVDCVEKELECEVNVIQLAPNPTFDECVNAMQKHKTEIKALQGVLKELEQSLDTWKTLCRLCLIRAERAV